MFVEGWLDAVVLLVTGPSFCSGVVIDSAGTIATAYHCVASGGAPQISWRDGTTLIGKVVARDPAHDLALITVESDHPLVALSVRRSEPQVGERVWAVGHPFASNAGGKLNGLLRWSTSEGVISAKGEWYYQTDAALNPGNSGGPLIDDQGQVVGIVSRKLSAENISFATRSGHLLHLLASPSPGTWFGGSYGLGPGIIQTTDTLFLTADVWASIRDRVVLRGWAGFEPQAGTEPVGAATLEARQRFGRGSLTATVDLGVGALAPNGNLTPVLSGRLGLGEVGFGVMVAPGPWTWSLSLDLGLPGELGVF